MRYWVVYGKYKPEKHQAFSKLETAQEFEKQNQGKNIYGIYDIENRKIISKREGEYDDTLIDYFKKQFPDPLETAKLKKEWRKQKIRVTIEYIKYFGILLITIVVSGYLNKYLGWGIKPYIGGSLATLFYGSGTLGFLVTWHVQTFGGESSPEKLNTFLFISSYIIGTVFTVLSFEI